MNRFAESLTNWFKSKKAIKIASIIALLCAIIEQISSWFYYDYLFTEGKLFFTASPTAIIFSIVLLAPNILLVVYAFLLREKIRPGTFFVLYLLCVLAINLLPFVRAIATDSLVGALVWPNYQLSTTAKKIYEIFISCLINGTGAIARMSMLLFGVLKNTGATVSINGNMSNSESLDIEKSLTLLRDKYELGIITEEEYQAQRAEIINKL